MSIEIDAKAEDHQLSSTPGTPDTEHSHAAHAELSEEARAEERALMRKIDMRLIPWLSLLYLLAFLDRSAIGNAKLYGLATDLRLTDSQYLITLTVFFISYSVFEVPSNILLKRLRPSIWLPFIMVAWGVCMLSNGFVTNYAGLTAVRWFLGVTEAGLFPGVNLSCWYKRSEFGLRAAVFFSAATVSGAFGGLIAAGIGSGMEGVGGKPSWAWIFILEGLVTILVAIASFWVVADFPDTAKFLTPREREIVVRRLQEDEQFSAAGEGFQWSAITQSLADWRTWVGMVAYMGVDGPLYAFSLFTPSIVKELGYTATIANLLTVPIYVWACLLTIGVGFAADRYKTRIKFNLVFLAIGAAGYIILIASRNAALSYFAIYLAASGIFPLIPNTVALISNNVEGSYKRSVSLGMVISWGNLNGAVSSNIYRAVQRPWYPLGHGIVLCYIGLGVLSNLVYWYFTKKENDARDRGERDEAIGGVPLAKGELRDGKGHGGWYATIQDAKADKGDNWSGYR
ncbi:MFS transporter, ACS family, pantothenate transporter, partial [Phenoliferia sp. Uapishka_3]